MAVILSCKRYMDLENLNKAECYFEKSNDQIVSLELQLLQLQKRYFLAREAGQKCFRYSLRLRMAVTEAMRDIYYKFSKVKGREIVRLRQELFGEDIEFLVSDSEDEEDFTLTR
ncbi:uncharacterized protein LOC134248627 [Saccostrea cucullata]|uniref:uncharacterized protein LOC134248627 n=1 Tax=Saccostrea cuccullata TaxID=36930 RepID=UPI002ED1C09E